jgi:hypothetical protein
MAEYFQITEGALHPPLLPSGAAEAAIHFQCSTYRSGYSQLKPVEVHHFCPCCNKICHKALFRVT